ncbi:hypothetical protein A0H81_06723 [Grifola frondosa]|uniref:Uncharacterized protein n=1 Tax=Grifola frondosa TaxID=5627 RepID=A0A1C7M9J6_GRIFR|nr:hypothetical protein A0H81_06723 [Grifola frondosa]
MAPHDSVVAKERETLLREGWTLLVSEDHDKRLWQNISLGEMGYRNSTPVELDNVEGACDRCWSNNRALTCAIKPTERLCKRCTGAKLGCGWKGVSRDARFWLQCKESKEEAEEAKKQASYVLPKIKIPPMHPAAAKTVAQPQHELKSLPQCASEGSGDAQVPELCWKWDNIFHGSISPYFQSSFTVHSSSSIPSIASC